MKKLLTIAFAMLLGATLSMAQQAGGTPASTDKPATTTKAPAKTHTHAKKGATKKKKGTDSTKTPAPK
jgi:hypothetical protein